MTALPRTLRAAPANHGSLSQPRRWRALIFGDGTISSGTQTGAERQAVALASAMLLELRHHEMREGAEARGVGAKAWSVQTDSLSAVAVPMPRLFRPLAERNKLKWANRLARELYVLAPSIVSSIDTLRSAAAGAELPAPFNSQTADYTSTLLFSAGSGPSAAALLRRSEMPGSTLIQMLHPRHSVKEFDLVVTPEHDFRSADHVPGNVLTVQGSLHDISRARLSAHAAKSPCSDIEALGNPRIGVLLGGPRARMLPASGSWGEASARDLAHRLATMAGPNGSVVVTQSRRTPDAFSLYLQRALTSTLGSNRVLVDNGMLRSRYLYILASADALVVTADSANMISEASASGPPVYVYGESGSRRIDRLVTSLCNSGRVSRLSDDSSAGLRGAIALDSIIDEGKFDDHGRPRELHRVANEAIRRLGIA